jgi:hypothetical protein
MTYEQLVEILEQREFLTRNAAENNYCPSCDKGDDRWHDQYTHYEGCPFLALLTAAKNKTLVLL